jgi:glucose-1-phosphate cytidylyltransferase
MKVVILCGGHGTRIRDVADDIPKPMIPIGGYPILWHIMKYYASFNFKEFVLCLGYKSHVIRNFFLNYDVNTNDITFTLGQKGAISFLDPHHKLDWKITMAETGLDAMTGSRIKKIQKYVEEDDDFLLTYGDGVGNIDIQKLIEFHKSHGKVLTVSGVRPPARFGEIRSTAKGKVTEFNEKTQTDAGMISGGFFVCRKSIFKYLNDKEGLVFELGPMQELVRKGEMMVYEHKGFWQPMDTSRDYLLLNSLFNEGKAPWVVWK